MEIHLGNYFSSYNNEQSDIGNLDEKLKMSNGWSIFSAYAAGTLTQNLLMKKIQSPVEKMFENGIKSLDRNANFKKAVYKSFDESVLPQKGVSFLSRKDMLESLERTKSQNSFKQRFLNLFNDSSMIREIKAGTNAAYFFKSRLIGVNVNKKAALAFHEMGHAFNYNTKSIGRLLTLLKPLGSLLTGVAFYAALLRKPKSENESSETFTGKFLDFIKENCTGLAALGYAPNLLEEGLASIKGYNLAKNNLCSSQLKKIVTLNGKGWLTYLTLSAIGTAGVYVTNKVRNITS